MEAFTLLIYNKTKSGRLVSVVINELDSDTDNSHILIANNVDHLKVMIKKTIKKGLEKNNQITWNKDTDNEISIFKDKEYSDYPEEHAETIRYVTKTISKHGRTIETNVRTIRNPDFVDNPECEFCYEKKVKLYKDHLLDKNKTEKMVCSGCKNHLAQMRKIMEKMEAKKK